MNTLPRRPDGRRTMRAFHHADMPMLATTSLLLAYQLAGEIIVQAPSLPVPDPMIGMALLPFQASRLTR